MVSVGAELLVWATAVVLGTCVLLVVLVVAVRVQRRGRERRDAMLLAPLRRPLVVVAAGEDLDGSATDQLTWATGATRAVLDAAIVELLTKVRGLPAEQLVGVLVAHGAVERARADLTHRSLVRRARAAQLLGLAGDPADVPRLVEALGDRSAAVRDAAAYGLGLIGDPAAAAAVLEATGAPHGGLPASTAAEALQSMGVGVSAVLADALCGPSARTRTVAAHLSGDRSFTRSLPTLSRLLDEDPDLTVREACAAALGRLGREAEVAVLARHAAPGSPAGLRRVCVAALGELGQAAAVPVLVGVLEDADPRLAELAATSLLALGEPGEAGLGGHEHLPAVRSARAVTALRRAHA